MNAKLAVAISLGASSLALFGMANVANAATAPTTDTGANQPVVQPSNENPVEKAKGEANKAIEDAKTQKETVTKEVEDAESEAKDANSKAIDANNEVTEAQKDLKDKQKEANTAEEEKGKADKELADQQTAIDKADKEVKATKAAFDKETENQKTAENKLNKTKDEKGKVEGELNTEKEAVKAKTTELANAGNTVKDEQGKLDTANTQLEKAKKDRQDAQTEADRLSGEADQKEQAQKEADQKVEENTKQQENIQKQIDNLKAAGSGTTNAEVQELKNKAEKAKQDYDQANTTATQKAQDAQKAADDIKTKHTALTKAEDELKNKNANYAGLIEKVTSAEGEAAKKAAAYDAADKNAPKDDIPVEQKSDFYKFLQYVIDTENAKGADKNTDLIADAQRAQKVLKGENYEVPRKVIRTIVTDQGTSEEIVPAYTAYAPTWYNDLVKPGLGRVGSADSLENMKQAATYYKALDDYRQKDVPGMKTVKVRLTFIAESIVHSFYSAAIIGHAACHDTMGSKTPDELKTHAYNTNVAENVAWDADYNDYDSNRPKQDLKQCNTNNGHLSCTYEGNKKHNALDAWYGLEKQIYDKALKDKKWNNHEFTEDGLTALKDHRTDFGTYLGNHPNLALFKDDSNGETKNLFKNVVGHYTNFSANNNFASGFAKADNSNTKMLGYEDIAVWHGGNEESSISIDDYQKLLNEYAENVNPSNAALEPENAEDLKKLNADANSANMAVFNAKYDALSAKHNMSNTDRSAVEALENKITEASKDFEEAKAKATTANEASDKAAKKAAELQTAWTTANSAYEAAKQKAENDAQLGKEARQQQISQLTTELNGLIAKAVTLKTEAETAKQTAYAARTAAKAQQAKVDNELTKAVNEAQVRFDTATQAVKEANANKAKVDKELQAAKDKVTNLNKTIQTLETQIATESKKVEDAESEVQAARAALQDAQTTQSTVTTQLKALQTKAQKAAEKVETEKAAVEVAKKAVVEKIKLAQTAVANAQAKVADAKRIAEAAKTKIETIQKNLKTAEEKFKVVVTDPATQQSFMQSTFLASYPEFESFVQILTGKVSTLQTTATNLTKSATALNDQLQKVAPDSVVTPPAPTPEPPVPPAPKPPVVVPSHDGESGHGNTGNTGNTNNTGNTENAGNTGNSNVPFTPQAPHVSVPAVDVEQQSNEFASATAENHVTQAVAKSEAGKSTKEERANAKNTKHANHTASANAAATSNSGVAQSKNAKDSKNAESKESAKEDSAKQETQDSNSNSSDQNSTPNNTPSNESKNTQANGSAAKAQNGSNNTLTIGAVVAVVIAGIVAIGGGVTFARHRRM
ncbi:hypothetical protein ACLD5W_01260 [Gardnerella greenwoodii]|uniref:hypothetical protein n=1 Tax=Gardnerella greenwoodii TaxID=2914925 RepID=UPI0039708C81